MYKWKWLGGKNLRISFVAVSSLWHLQKKGVRSVGLDVNWESAVRMLVAEVTKYRKLGHEVDGLKQTRYFLNGLSVDQVRNKQNV